MNRTASLPLGRILREHRLSIGVLAVLLAINLAALVVGVLPLARAVGSAEGRAAVAARELAAAHAEVEAAKAAHASKDRAHEDLDAFYAKVLPAGAAAARTMLHTAMAQLAAAEGVTYLRLSATTERDRDSTLERMRTQMMLDGDYGDIRRFIHAIESSEDFVIIDNMLIAEGSQSGGGGLALTLNLATYYRAEGTDGR